MVPSHGREEGSTDTVLPAMIPLEALAPFSFAHLLELLLAFDAAGKAVRVVCYGCLWRLLELLEIDVVCRAILGVLRRILGAFEARRNRHTKDGLVSIWRTERVWSSVVSTMTMRRRCKAEMASDIFHG